MTCIYCDQDIGEGDEYVHVICGLYGGNTVPAHKQCHEDAEEDDDAFYLANPE